jgi:hypothetical protein
VLFGRAPFGDNHLRLRVVVPGVRHGWRDGTGAGQVRLASRAANRFCSRAAASVRAISAWSISTAALVVTRHVVVLAPGCSA